MSQIQIKEVQSKAEMKQFVNFQYELYKNADLFVPPMKGDEMKSLDPKNPAASFTDSKFFLAVKDGKVVGRIGAIINHPYNEKTGKKYGRLNRVEFIDDAEVADALFNAAESWIKEQGMELAHGPLGYTSLDTQGLLIEGFDHLPSIASVYHLPYYQAHFERLGYAKENDWVEFRLTINKEPFEKAKRGAALIQRRFGYELHNFTKREELKPYTRKIFTILNDAFKELPYVVDLNEQMIDLYIGKYFSMLNPKFIKVVTKDGEPVGFFVGLPSLSRAMQKAGGKLFPFGFWHLMQALKNPTVIDMLLTGVAEDHQSNGVAVILISALQEEMMSRGINTLETTGIFETNENAIANWKNYENIQHKRRRCYVKQL